MVDSTVNCNDCLWVHTVSIYNKLGESVTFSTLKITKNFEDCLLNFNPKFNTNKQMQVTIDKTRYYKQGIINKHMKNVDFYTHSKLNLFDYFTFSRTKKQIHKSV